MIRGLHAMEEGKVDGGEAGEDGSEDEGTERLSRISRRWIVHLVTFTA
jgi:hypothetical protein